MFIYIYIYLNPKYTNLIEIEQFGFQAYLGLVGANRLSPYSKMPPLSCPVGVFQNMIMSYYVSMFVASTLQLSTFEFSIASIV